jgi:hypothetical protein
MTAFESARGRQLALPRARPSDRAAVLSSFFAIEFGALVLLQKFALPAGGMPVSLLIPILYVGLGYAAITFNLGLSLPRMAAFGLFLLFSLISQLLVGQPFSATSFLLLLALYFPLACKWSITIDQYRRVIGIFQNVMLFAAILVFIQLAWQFAFGLGVTLNLERFVPHQLLLPGYIYEGGIRWGFAFIRPNGLFFLEPSFASMFIATALILELTEFSRPLRIGLYAGALIGCVAATGFVVLLVAAPGILRRLKPRMLLTVLLMTVTAAIVAAPLGGADLLVRRLGELDRPNTSGSERLVAPLRQLGALSSDPERLLTGAGAGNVSMLQASPWPIVKLLSEYGAMTTLAYLLLVAAALWRAPNRTVAGALFVVINFTGGYLLSPVTTNLLILLLSLPRPTAARAQAAPRRRVAAEAAASAA